eukprot:jgi/Chlat1/974/Chrsp108S01394
MATLGIPPIGLTGAADPILELPPAVAPIMLRIGQLVQENPVQLFTKSYCPYSARVRQLLKDLRVPYNDVMIDTEDDTDAWQLALGELTVRTTVPNVWIGGQHVGGHDEVMALMEDGMLLRMFRDLGIPVRG